MARILIIDDDPIICEVLTLFIEKHGHSVIYALQLKQGLHICSQEKFAVVFLDVHLPDGNGLDALPDIQKTIGLPEVIMITGEGDPDVAEMAIKSGAWDYLEKPISQDKISLPLIRALRHHEKKNTIVPLGTLIRDDIIGESPQIVKCLDHLARAATSEANTLIFGETGTGKELFAKAIHQNSQRKQNNFIVVDCAAIPENLVESTLFGHHKGAFTGADKDRDGLIGLADNGTLFLDEVGELPLATQKAFLRVLQEKKYRRIGGKHERRSDFRLVAATNRDLDRMVQEGSFRQDLLFRLRAITIELPALNERTEDIKILAEHFAKDLCKRAKIGPKAFSQELLFAFSRYNWPGNIRELISTIESVISAAGDSPTLFPDHLPTYFRASLARASVKTKEQTSEKPDSKTKTPLQIKPLKEYRETVIQEIETRYLQNLMAVTSWKIKDACLLSGLSRPRLYALLKKYHITR